MTALDDRAARRLSPGSQNFISFQDAPELPRFLSHGSGPFVWDMGGRRYIDLYGGSGSIILGHGDPAQTEVLRDRLSYGGSSTFRHVVEIEVAEWLADHVPCAERTVFFKTGSEAAHAAVVAALRYTGRDLTIAMGYHGWLPPFVPFPPGSNGFFIPESSWDLDMVIPTLREHSSRLGVVIVGPDPAMVDPEFYRTLQEETRQLGAVFVMDEIKSGFRVRFPAVSSAWNLAPDLVLLGKALSNGFPLATLSGRDAILGAERNLNFFSTFATEELALFATRSCLQSLGDGKYGAFERAATRLHETLSNRLATSSIRLQGESTLFRLIFHDTSQAVEFARRLAMEGILYHPLDCVNLSAAHDDEIVLSEIADTMGSVARAMNVL